MNCSYCKSDILYLKEEGDKISLYCKNCQKWLKWVDKEEAAAIKATIEKQKREVVIDGDDIKRALEKYGDYKKKYKVMNDDIIFRKDRIVKNASEMEKNTFYSKVKKLKELSVKISSYEEIFNILRITH